MKLTASFLRHLSHAHNKLEMVLKRERVEKSTSFNLEALDDQICYQRIGFVICGLPHLAYSQLGATDRKWTSKWHHCTNQILLMQFLLEDLERCTSEESWSPGLDSSHRYATESSLNL